MHLHQEVEDKQRNNLLLSRYRMKARRLQTPSGGASGRLCIRANNLEMRKLALIKTMVKLADLDSLRRFRQHQSLTRRRKKSSSRVPAAAAAAVSSTTRRPSVSTDDMDIKQLAKSQEQHNNIEKSSSRKPTTSKRAAMPRRVRTHPARERNWSGTSKESGGSAFAAANPLENMRRSMVNKQHAQEESKPTMPQ